MMKSWNWISAIGRNPFIAAPMATPTMSDSASGLSSTRASPNSFCKPSVTPKTPPLAPTSSPRIITRSSRCISSRMPSRIASIYVFSATPVTRFRIHVKHRRVRSGQRRFLGLLGRFVELDHQLRTHLLRVARSKNAKLLERRPEAQQGVPLFVGLEILGGAVATLVVVGAVRCEPEHLRLDERRAVTATRALYRLASHPVAGDGV